MALEATLLRRGTRRTAPRSTMRAGGGGDAAGSGGGAASGSSVTGSGRRPTGPVEIPMHGATSTFHSRRTLREAGCTSTVRQAWGTSGRDEWKASKTNAGGAGTSSTRCGMATRPRSIFNGPSGQAGRRPRTPGAGGKETRTASRAGARTIALAEPNPALQIQRAPALRAGLSVGNSVAPKAGREECTSKRQGMAHLAAGPKKARSANGRLSSGEVGAYRQRRR